MKKCLVVLMLLALLLAMACPAQAEEEGNVTEADLLGVWKSEDEEALTVLILPGIYAPQVRNTNLPPLFVDAVWQENEDQAVQYYLAPGRRTQGDNSLLKSLFGSTMANTVQVISQLMGNKDEIPEDFDAFNYSHGTISAVWGMGDDEETLTYTNDASGAFYATRMEDESLCLIWVDDYDPHIAAQALYRVVEEAPSAEALTQGVLRPVIDMADGAEAQTALTVMQWASDNHCMRVETTALKDSLRAALDALESGELQSFRTNYGKISRMMTDAMRLNAETWADPDRDKPFKDAGLEDALDAISSNTENQRALELLNAAIVEVAE